ncbi:MAG: regulatory protein RecX [Armatimonadetes bacterium]|nr:regulatory protein RecX [Armatimonadota bacterium]
MSPRVARLRVSAREPGVCRVEIEGVGRFQVDARTVGALGLAEGQAIAPEVVGRLVSAAERQRARTVALGLLQRRLRSRAELESALRRRGVPRDEALAAIGELARSGWIDDARFARAWIADRLALRPSGARRLRTELAIRGVAPAVIAEALAAQLLPEQEEAMALRQAGDRLRRLRGLPPNVARRRLVGWLQRRGYSSGTIARALRKVGPPGEGSPDDDSSD